MVMPALVAGIHAFDPGTKTGGRNKSSHDKFLFNLKCPTYRTVRTARTARTHRPADGPSRRNPIRDDGLTRWREAHQMKKEYLVLTIILAISLIVTLVLLIGTPSFTCKAEGKCLDPMGLCWILADS